MAFVIYRSVQGNLDVRELNDDGTTRSCLYWHHRGVGLLQVNADRYDLGFAQAWPLSRGDDSGATAYNYFTHTREVIHDVPGRYARAVPLPTISAGPCAGCFYQTGEDALPCAVNPLAYGQGCRDYTN